MFCEAYYKPVSDAAASGEPLSRVLQQHLASCDSCHAAFAEEQSLFAAIDAGLRASANSEVPATLVPRIRVALNNDVPAPQRSFQRWILAGAVAACALGVAVTLQLRHREGPTPNRIAGTQTPTLSSPRLVESNLSAPPALHPGSRQANNPETLHPTSAAVALSIAPEVLVPDEERAAFATFLASNQSTRTTVSAVSHIPEAPRVLSPLEPVEIASLRVPSLEGEEARRAGFEQIPSASQPSKEMK